MSKFLVREAEPGLVVHLSQAEGEFTLTESPATPTNNHLLMISGGSGITPVMSHLRTLLRDGYDGKAGRKVTFLHYARSREDQIFAEELQRIAWADNGVDVHLRYGDDVFSVEALRRLVPSFRDTDTWACGPAGLMELVLEAYEDSPRLRTEYFKLSTRPVGRHRLGGGRPVVHADRDLGRQLRRLDPRAGRRGRALTGVRLPHGHLLHLHLPQARGDGAQRPDRRGVGTARRGHPHLRQRPCRRLRRRPLTTTRRPHTN